AGGRTDHRSKPDPLGLPASDRGRAGRRGSGGLEPAAGYFWWGSPGAREFAPVVGAPRRPRPHAGEYVWHYRDHGPCHLLSAPRLRFGDARGQWDWKAAPGFDSLYSGSGSEPGPHWSSRGTLRWGRWSGTRLFEPAGANGREVRAQPVQRRARGTAVPDGR